MELKSEVTKVSDTRVKVSAEVDADTVSKELNVQYKKYANKYKFPGFRAGHAPRPVIDNAVGKETVYLDATEEVLNDAYHVLIEQESLRPVGEPNFEGKENEMLVEDKKPFKFEFELEVSPVVELDSYEPVEAYLPPTEATAEDIESQIDLYKGYAGVEEGEELTEEIIKEKMGFESEEKLREAIQGLVENEKKGALPRLKEDVVSLKLRERVQVEPTDEMVDYINNVLLNEMFQNLQQYGMTFDQYLASRKMSSDEFYDDVQKQAVDEAKTRMALDAWVRHFGLATTDEDITEEFEKAGIKDVEKTKKQWAESGRLWRLREAIERSKAVENAVENAKFTFDAEKAEHQFDYLNEDAENKDAEQKTNDEANKAESSEDVKPSEETAEKKDE
ncbi:trigger factor [Phoenicibacter congonensis]|uniref:trigger factor n=1 Tax=Phoenicibacter congonensis TaxID=1944646 RepID=UPI0009A82FB9|nr:trigger factor [Phoenicibacter congonensis]